jgi:Fur family ferric uptake transcriptional regulator
MVPSPEAVLRGAGLRVTKPRIAVLNVLVDHPHATVERVTDDARATLGSISRQAIYDVLAAFVAAGVVRRIEPAGSPTRFEWQTDDDHHHLICRACGQVEDAATGGGPCLVPTDDAGYLVDAAEVVFWGLCAAAGRKPRLET